MTNPPPGAAVPQEELEAIRARQEADRKTPVWGADEVARAMIQARTDRATLLRAVDRLTAELARAKQAIKVQASAVKTLQAAEDSEINVLRSKATEAHRAVVTLDSERAMNATLTEEIDRLSAELAKERERRVEWQPIETAPRDGQDILVYCQDTNEMFVGFSNPEEIAADPGIFFYALRTDGRRIGCRPHLWRSLPTPPATTQHEDTP